MVKWVMALNVLGEDLQLCSADPLTGFYRDGCCNTGADDIGLHAVCAQMTDEFLEFSRASGNDLSRPKPDAASPVLSQATAGAYARRVGRRHSMPEQPHRWSWRRPMPRSSSGLSWENYANTPRADRGAGYRGG